MKLEERAAQILATTDDDRDAMDEKNPVIYAEAGPNRFYLMSLFFSDSDGVQIQEDQDLSEITVMYFQDGEGSIQLFDGPVYDWAVNFYKNNW